jgi:hypothetical protein
MTSRWLRGLVLLALGGFVAGCGLDSSTAPRTGAFRQTGAMLLRRLGHSATLLQDGRVLIAGGEESVFADGVGTDHAEAYDPGSETFSAVGRMIHPRAGHVAALLRDGRVLVVGGGRTVAEIFDPQTGGFVATGGLELIDRVQTATPLLDGRVFVTGDLEFYAEIYDPATGAFARTPRLRGFRTGHTATLLPSGRVLIIGGASPRSETFDPQSSAFTVGPRLLMARFGHTATQLADGKFLVAGGSGLVEGNVTGPLRLTEIHDPARDEPSAANSMAYARFGHTATLLSDGRILVLGGAEATAEVYDPADGFFQSVGDDAGPVRSGFSATLLNDGRVLIAGGVDRDFVFVDRPFIFEP